MLNDMGLFALRKPADGPRHIPGGKMPSSSEPDAVLSEAEDDWSESFSTAATGKPSRLDPSAGTGTTGTSCPSSAPSTTRGEDRLDKAGESPPLSHLFLVHPCGEDVLLSDLVTTCKSIEVVLAKLRPHPRLWGQQALLLKGQTTQLPAGQEHEPLPQLEFDHSTAMRRLPRVVEPHWKSCSFSSIFTLWASSSRKLNAGAHR